MNTDDISQPTILRYQVAECSSYSAGYRPDLIMEDRPAEQASRWSSASNDTQQYLTLRLEQPALICSEIELRLTCSTYNLWKVPQEPREPDTTIPAQFVKIAPLAAWGNSFNYSIWYVELRGVTGPSVAEVQQKWTIHLDYESWRLCLQFLREKPGMEEAFAALQSRTGVKLEDPLVSQLFDCVVKRGAFTDAESLLAQGYQEDSTLFEDYIRDHVPYQPQWSRLDHGVMNSNGNPSQDSSGGTIEENSRSFGPRSTNTPAHTHPAVRGGHQMVWDPVGRSIYLFGGWDGHRDLGDFWRYNVATAEWSCLSEDARREGGPGPRSCHKMVLHTALRRLYVFGRYVDTETRASTALTSEFFYYDLERHTWTSLGEDVHPMGGPGLIYDHQMAIDEDRNIIYVFGGRLISHSHVGNNETLYSGLYSYDITGNRWRLVRSDQEIVPGSTTIKSRIGHSMIFNPTTRQLDFYVYDVDRNTVVEMVKETNKLGGPDAGFTQRSTLDVAHQELFLFSGLMREKSGSAFTGPTTNNGQVNQPIESARNSFWLYNLRQREWIRLYSNEANPENEDTEPCPRFAHQLVYDPESRTHYLFGGNPGESSNPRRRLGDFWQLYLHRRRRPADILRRSIFLLRRQQFFEMCYARRDSTPASPSM
ncbi:hypothetical protein PSACC_02688, partial [Paramicrosporidium saccamoebae]